VARYFLFLSYDGIPFNGWQIQKNTPYTVQQILEEKISLILNHRVELTGCGRTDTGVSAKNYVAHFDFEAFDLLPEKKHWLYKFNMVLPSEISVNDIRRVEDKAHARYDALNRTYDYYISRKKNPFRQKYTWFLHGDLDFNLMNACAAELLHHNDFTSFSKLHTQNKTNFCRIIKAEWKLIRQDEWRFEITADRFLRGMVRAIVGTQVLVGQKKITAEDFRKIILARNRKAAGANAPSNALFLVKIKYPTATFLH